MRISRQFMPIMAALMRSRLAARLIAGAALVQGGLVMVGLPGWQCPLLHGLGIPCPGCGLSRASIALLRGDWQTALRMHAFAPIMLLALALFFCAAVLPERPQEVLCRAVEAGEGRTGLGVLRLVGWVVCWAEWVVCALGAFL